MRVWLSILLLAFLTPVVCGQDGEEFQPPPKVWSLHAEVKAHYRWSEDASFRLRFPFPPELIPAGQDAVFLQTVSPGSSFEVSAANVTLDVTPAESITGRVKIAFIDLYNRNPTSTDQTVNVKEAWVQFGRRGEFMRSDSGTAVFALFGKAPKFERQPDRNLESYGLVSTAFNRLEDLQLQLGGQFGGNVYWRFQVSNGNPVFFRDVNALAGDNGSDDFRFPNPELHLNSGFPIFYDAEVEDVSFDKTEVGGGLGLRFQSDSLEKGFNFLVFYYQRDLADRVDLRGTFYGGDLDLLDGPPGSPLPIQGNEKKEYGVNADVRLKGFHAWFQGVHQELAGLERDGYEVEVLWRFGLPLAYSAGGKQLFTFIQPAFRFSLMDNKFIGNPLFVSTFWGWRKFDIGVRLGIIKGVDLTVEYTINDIRALTPFSLNEFLATLRIRF